MHFKHTRLSHLSPLTDSDCLFAFLLHPQMLHPSWISWTLHFSAPQIQCQHCQTTMLARLLLWMFPLLSDPALLRRLQVWQKDQSRLGHLMLDWWNRSCCRCGGAGARRSGTRGRCAAHADGAS